MLRQLAVYHGKDTNNMFCVRLAQGLTHLGKGTLTVCPYHSDRQILSPVAVAGILAVLISCLDVKNCECHDFHRVYVVIFSDNRWQQRVWIGEKKVDVKMI